MHHLKWYIEGKAVLIELSGEVDAAELAAINYKVIDEYYEKANNEVHLIADNSKVDRFTVNVYEAVQTSKILAGHPRKGLSIYIALLNPVQTMVAKAVTQTLKTRVRFVTTFDEVDQILEEIV